VLGESVLDADGTKALASLPTGPEIYSRLAGAVNGNARGLASVISGMHRSLAYVLQACIDAQVFEGDLPAPVEPEAVDETPAPVSDATDVADDAPAADAAPEVPADDAVAEDTPAVDEAATTESADAAAETEE